MWIKIDRMPEPLSADPVTSFTLVWIKIWAKARISSGARVTSFTLVWIKIEIHIDGRIHRFRSRASRSCGLKYVDGGTDINTLGHELHARVD